MKNNVNEKEDTILYLLNNKNILEHNKISIIEKQDILINDLGGVPEDLRINFFKLDKFIVNWYNISVCSVFEDESILVNFLNKEENYIRLSNEDIGREYEIESSYIECICKIILTNDDINKKSFEHLLDNTKYICDIYLGKNKSFEEFVEYNLNIINYKKVKII